MTIQFKKMCADARLPNYKHESDSGMDIHSRERLVLPPMGRATVQTGVSCKIPDGYELQVRPRSGMSRKGVVAMFGTVDCGYRGEIGVTLINFSNKEYNILVGDRIAQLVLSKVDKCEVRWGKFRYDTDRGTSGFGSTGR